MKHVTGHHIAYAAVQVCLFFTLATFIIIFQARFALSDKDNWQDNDDHFCYSDFYNEIVNVFEDDLDDKVILETLIFWNQ